MRRKKISSKLLLLAVALVGSMVKPMVNANANEVAYPFIKGNRGFDGGVTWTGPTKQSTSMAYQFLEVKFGGAKDVSNADYLAIQYRADVGGPDMTYGLLSNGDRWGIANTPNDTVSAYFLEEDGTINNLGKVTYDAVNVPQGKRGALLLSLKEMQWQWNVAGASLEAVTSFYLTTNSEYNWNWTMSIGSVGVFTGVDVASAVYTSLFDASLGTSAADYYYDSQVETSLDFIVGYPLPVGETAFNGGKKWVGPVGKPAATDWETIFVNFKNTVDLTAATALAVQYRADLGAPGMTWAVENSGTRYSTQSDGKPLYFQDEGKMAIYKVADVLYSAVGIAQGKVGIGILPIDSLVKQWGNNNLSAVQNFLLTTNSEYNYDWAVSVGAVGYLDSNYDYHPIEIEYYYNAGANCMMETINVVEDVGPTMPTETTYPFRTGGLPAFTNGKTWVGPPTAAAESGDIQRLTITFDNVTDMRDATYLAIQMATRSGNPGVQYGIETNTNLYATIGVDGEQIYWISEDGLIKPLSTVLYDHITGAISNGVLLIPMAALAPTGEKNSDGLETAKKLWIQNDRKYNYNFQLTYGEIGFYKGEIGSQEMSFTKLLDLSSNKSSSFVLTGVTSQDSKLIEAVERTTYGDTAVTVTMTGKSSSNFSIWSGGSHGLAEMTTDSYGDDAVKLQATDVNAEGDSYTAIDIASGRVDWSAYNGVTFWAKNDSNKEVSFNFEIDCRHEGLEIKDRFNIKQGHRFWLYDVNTGKTSIYMTKPVATLPVGFEGWVRIPFTAFDRASWSNNGLTKADFMAAGTVVTYLAITIHAPTYRYLPFSINKIGAYGTTPIWDSAYVTGTPILGLMDLED